MESIMFLRGMLIGFSVAAPVGPIGLLCVRRTLAEGRISGFLSGLGAATADAVYGSIAGFGLVYISNLLIRMQLWFELAGGVFLCFLGIMIFSNKVKEIDNNRGRRNLFVSYISTFFLTIANPVTILSFGAIFVGMGIINTRADYFTAMLLVLGVFFGSALWWMILSGGVGIFRSRVKLIQLQWINRLFGAIIFFFGLFNLASLILPGN